MRGSFTISLILLTVLSVRSTVADPAQSPIASVDAVYPAHVVHIPAPHEPPGAELSAHSRDLRGVYLPIPLLRSWKPHQIRYFVQNELGANAVVLDMKDDRGRVTFSHRLPGAKGHPHGLIPHMKDIIQALQQAGIYVIGRLVCFKDNQFVRRHPEVAIRDRRTGDIWRDTTGLAWLDPHSEVARDYIVAMAREVERMGVDEVQLDYVRFPVENSAKYMRFPGRRGNPRRYELIASLVAHVDLAVKLPLSVDVFGLTAYHYEDNWDVDHLGQSLEHLAPYLDAISPMLYLANWPKEKWENPVPSATAALIHDAVFRIRQRLGDEIAVRPLLQGFKWRAKNYGVRFIVNQINAAHTAGGSGHLFWNQLGRYTKVMAGWKRWDRVQQKTE